LLNLNDIILGFKFGVRFFMFFITIALLEEAKPLIEFYKLKSLQNKKFNIFRNENIVLIVTGVGKLKASIATTYLSCLFKSEINSYLNIGIAGHANLEIGKLIWVEKIADESIKKNYFPTLLVDVKIPTKSLMTVDKLKEDYEFDFVYDMEGSGFFEAALKFTYVDLIHSLKIISDNKFFKFKELSKEKIYDLISQNLENIDVFIKKLMSLKSKIQANDIEISSLEEKFRLTQYEKDQIKNLIWKIKALKKDFQLEDVLKNCNDKKQIFKLLEDTYMKTSLIL
jgi:hypothetical protein